jgi:hypothetical protein
MFGVLGGQAPTSVICDDVRIQLLSPSLVRIERKGSKGFEDRTTFNVVNRQIGNVSVQIKQVAENVEIRTSRFVLRLPQHPTSLSDVSIVSPSGDLLYRPSGEPVRAEFLPSPANMPKVWAMSDYPRLVPPAWGATPPPNGEPSSGWDRSNNAPDLYVFVPASYEGLRRDFLALTGPIEKPPLYTFGFIDSRYHPYTETEALGVIDTYRRKRIPLDMFVVDTDWRPNGSDGYAIETKYFPDMPRFIREAHARNVRLMFNDHPNPISKDPLDPRELQFRWDGLSKLMGMGLDAWWYDRNWFTSLGEPLPGLRKEVWGQRLYHDMALRFQPDRRPLIMTNFQGIDNGDRHYAPQPAGHRYPIWWTGDTQSTWEFLRKGVENGVDMGVLAVSPYVGEDLGGHVGQPSPELYVRYLQYGLLSPTARIHCTRGNTRYPWEFGPEAEGIVTDYVRLRYRLLPTLYSAAQRAYEDGTPLLRRLDLEWPTHKEASQSDEYLLGDDLLVAPMTKSLIPEPQAFPSEMLRTPDGKPGLYAEIFKGTELKGEPIAKRVDPQVLFNWGNGAPGPGLPSDGFSVRWTGKVGPFPQTREYSIGTRSDDGARLWIDGKLVIDKWVPQNDVLNLTKIRFEAGSVHDVRLEYFEDGGGAGMAFGWIPPAQTERTLPEREVWIPPGQWRSVYTGETIQGPRTITAEVPLWQCPMWARAGGLVTLAPEMQYTGQRPWDSLTLEAFCLERNGSATRVLAEDDGVSNAYQKGQVAKTQLAQRRVGNTVTLTLGATRGTFRGMPAKRRWRLRLNLPQGASVRSVSLDGRSARGYRVLEPSAALTGAPLRGGDDARGRVLVIDLPSADVRRAQVVAVELSR